MGLTSANCSHHLQAEEPPQPPLQQQQDQAGASLSRMGSLKAADWMDGGGKAGQAPSVTHHKVQATAAMRKEFLGLALSLLPRTHALRLRQRGTS